MQQLEMHFALQQPFLDPKFNPVKIVYCYATNVWSRSIKRTASRGPFYCVILYGS